MKEHEHRWVREGGVLADTGSSYHYFRCELCHETVYPMDQLQKMFDYAEEHQFMFLEDWILALFCASPDSHIAGRTSLQKQMFLVTREFAQDEGILTENVGFRAQKRDPHSDSVAAAIEEMVKSGIALKDGRKNSSKERLWLSEKGMDVAKGSFMKLTEGQRERLTKALEEYRAWGPEGLLRHVYAHYGESTREPAIKGGAPGLPK